MPTRFTNEDILDAIHFILAERARFVSIPLSELKNARDDLLYGLPNPTGRGEIIYGRKAEERLRCIALEARRRNTLDNRVALKTIRNLLASVLVRRFIVEGRPIDRQQIDRLISSVGRAARKACAAAEHFLPCHLMFVEEPDVLAVGPVLFRTRKGFRSRILQSVKTYSYRDQRWTRKLLADSLRYFRTFKWVAEVSIGPADGETSAKIAFDAVQSAINCLSLVFGAGSTNEMKIGGPPLSRDIRGHLHIGSAGELQVALSRRTVGEVGFGPGWSKQLRGSRAGRSLALSGVAVEAAVNLDLERPLSRRLLDAIHWFGEGARETSEAARVVKYVTALERMLMTSEHNNISSVVSDRAAAFCVVADPDIPLERWKSDCEDLYHLRSRLVHGDLSPYSLDVLQGAQAGERLSRLAILSVLNHFGSDGLRAENASTARLARWFDTIIARSKVGDRGVPIGADDA